MNADIHLLDAARTMDSDALIEIFDRYDRALYKYAIRLCRDEVMADQIVGDVFAKLLDQFSSGNGPRENLRSYLYTMTYNEFVTEIRYSHHRTQLEVVDFLQHDEQFLYRSLETKIIFDTITQSIRKNLTAFQRHVIILRFLEGFSIRETAAILGKSENHVKVTQNRAIASLRKAIGYKFTETSAISPLFASFISP